AVLERFRLADIELVGDDPRIVYHFSPGDVRIAVERRSANPSFAQTRSFNVFIMAAGPAELAADERRLVEHVISLVRANDPGAVSWQRAPTLFLVPGVIGNPADLGLRSVEILRRVRTVLVERGKERITSELLRFHGIPVEDKRVLPLPEDAEQATRLRDTLVASNESACLFGADEGVPGLSDPGKALLKAAGRSGDPLRVRTIGGPSALAMALLRVPVDFDSFVFVGMLDNAAEHIEGLLARDNVTTLVHFLGADADDVIRRIARLCLPHNRPMFLACNLTGEHEAFYEVRSTEDLVELPPLGSTHTVLVVGPATA
ncbi:MAG TPA: SAM-dependent methyltransferase, partial [Candidatus Binatia bacterium]|nr:SAM-dependent methyltransferase [Candidatus Binatia bacterium]